MEYRKAIIEDIDQLVILRKKQLIDEGSEPNEDIDADLYDFFHNKMSDGSLIEWIVVDHEEIVATGAIVFYEFPPSFGNKTGKKGYITNMYTKDNYRGQGIATQMLTKLMDEARIVGISKIWLGASTMGRPVYKKFGFVETDDYLELSLVTTQSTTDLKIKPFK